MAFDLNHSEEQRQILDAAAAMLNQSYPVSRLRENRADDLSEIAAFGAFSLALPEDVGGAGFTVLDEALLNVAFGRHVVSSRALAAAIAARLALAADRPELAGQLADGSLSACVALRDGDTVLSFDGDDAGLCVVFGDRHLTLAERDASQGERLQGLGHGVEVNRVAAASLPVLGETGDDDVLAVADLLISAQLLGIAEATRDLAVGYAQMRQQFGKPIAAFQAIKHRCADMAIAAEAASSLLDFAAIALVDGRSDAGFQIAALRRLATAAALGNARACIQIHGGIGFSAEADAHHFLKHAHLLSRLGSTSAMLDLPAPLAPNQTILERN